MKKIMCILLVLSLCVSPFPANAAADTTGIATVSTRTTSALKITKQPSDITVSQGETAKVTVSAQGNNLTYTWYYKDAGSATFKKTNTFKGSTYTVEMNAKRNGRQIYCVITDANDNSTSTEIVTLHMRGTPKITAQPKSVTVSNSKTAKVTVTASGDGLKYEWYYKNAGASSFKKTNTFKGNTYSVAMNANRDGRQIYCKITDKYGNSVKTDIVTLTMEVPLEITKQPVSAVASEGSKVNIAVSANGDGLKYEWYYKNAGAGSFKKTNTFKGNTYSVAMNGNRDGRQVYCKITDKYGNSVKTNVVTIHLGNALEITKQPVSAVASEGSKVKIAVSANGDGLKYEWYYKNAGASSFKKTNTFKGNTYSVAMNGNRDGRQVYCKITDKYGNSVKTNVVTIHLGNTLEITKQPISVSVNPGQTATVTISANGDGLKYEWYYKNAGASSFKKTNTFKGNTYSVAMNGNRDGRQIYCKITDQYGTSIKTNIITLSTNKNALSDNTSHGKCTACKDKTQGTTFGYDTVYTQPERLTNLPLTFEAVLQIDENDIDVSTMLKLDSKANYTETVLFSNDDTYDSSVCFSITEDGHPKLGLRQKDWYRRSYNFVFDDICVFSTDPIHLAITLDQEGNKVCCYINGELKQTITGIPEEVRSSFLPTYRYAVGGDHYSGNTNYFRGQLYSLSVWSDIRTADEISSDFGMGLIKADKALMASYNFTFCDQCMLEDLSTNNHHLQVERIWLDKEEVTPVGDYDYSFAVIGDTQELSEDDPEGLSALYKWIVDNAESQKIEYVLGMGDITQKSYAHEWAHAQKQIYQLNGVVPYLLARGNHDYNTVENGVITAGFNKTFDDGIYNQQLTGVMTKGDVSNAYRTINICGIDYLFLTLDFGPSVEMLQWADSVVSAHPNHRVILVTHGYLYRDGTTLDSEDAFCASKYPLKDRKLEDPIKPSLDGDDIWEQFASKHPNVQMVLSGHDPSQHIIYRQDQGDAGNTVTQMLIDPQGIDGFYEPVGMVAMFYFSNNGNTLTVRYYSILKDLYGSEQSQFTIDLT